jgi:hypothetical protein
MKNDNEAWSSHAKSKLQRNHVYITVDITLALYRNNMSVGWGDAHLLGGWLLNKRRLLVPLVQL